MAADSGTYDEATRLRRLKLAEAMLAKPNKPITHWAEGLSEMANGYLGGKMYKQAEDDAKASEAATNAAYLNFLKPGGSSSAVTPAPVADAGPAASPAAAPMGSAVATAMGSSPDASLPRGFRNNNPGNIEDGPFARSQPGYVGTDGRFAKFASMDNGTGAMSSLLGSYDKKGINTVNGIINRWAPASDGNPVNAYASTVAKEAGIDPNAVVTPEMRPAIIAAMAKFENGRPLPASQPASPSSQPAAAAPGAVDNPVRAQIATLLSSKNPAEQKLGRQLAQNLITQDAKGPSFDFKVAGDNLYRVNPKTGTAEPVRDVGRGVQPMTDEQRKQWKVPEGVAAGIDDNGKPVFSQPSNVNTVSPVVAGINDRFDAEMKSGKAAAGIINSIYETRRALDGGAFTGAGSNAKLFLAKVGTAFGLPDDKVTNTETARAAVGNSVLESAKTLGANPSNADREYIEKVKGGSIDLDEKSIRRIAEMQERWARDSIKRANESGKKMIATDPEKLGRFAPMLAIDDVPGYEDYIKTNPVTKSEPAAAAGWKDLGGGIRIREKK